ncbi:metal-dependent hydrolase [Acinetobacter ursingii]|uniref:Metal-dependent hydrolase n=1 Tax=Acinetobacter ursingii TaxID=108980 RepID=A0AA46NMI4_9GAMM|nr:metal-dependent hydrolase [Acinetobacter ursingii]MEC8057969.1 metal-dependent hydrolase [Pseudomonadota bacterium]NOZ96605.1 metal-dependent hydrolase [Gammaproteobacteria bacterium]MCU4350972.1 metal-dependent hydrolase [Acinetobacter ursingii]MCU4495626.1 metal-dependent hydrolase [Acinetobacter ursingii]MDH2017633.1 metal-dependent hydrolase [Acinetobacter ursingii]
MSLAQVTKQKSYLNRPKALGITVRRLQFHPEKIKRHYFANSPVMSHMLTALSSTFPIGEQFFVHSVRNVRDKVTDPTLQAQIAAFIGQEAMHSKAHSEFNDAWRRDHYNLDRFQAWLARKNIHVHSLHPKIQLAITCAFEHFTALLGGYILRHPEVLSTLDEDAIKLWVWHAIEEIEHRAVAFEVYQAVYGDDRVRRLLMRSVTTGFASLTLYSTTRLFWQDKWRSLPKIGGNLFGLYLLGKMLIQLLPEYLSYYKADFHPEEQDYSQIVKYWKEKMANEYHMQSFQEEVMPKLYS